MLHKQALVEGLLTSLNPSDSEAIHIPEITRLEQVPQNPKWHPEGSVFIHSMQVLNRAAKLRKYITRIEDKLPYMLAAWLHDIGKWENTFYKDKDTRKKLIHWSLPQPRNTKIVSYGHETSGMKMVRGILERELPEEYFHVISKVEQLVRYHMRPLVLQTSRLKVFKNMKNDGVNLFLVGMLNWADKGEIPEYWFKRIKQLNEGSRSKKDSR